jgi:hypothetical protein
VAKIKKVTERKKDYFPYLYWCLPFLLLIPQILFTFNSMNQIRYEELAESVRNVFWLQNGLVYDGVSSNIGWYGTLLVIYHLFGFSLFTAKIFRLALQLLSLLALAKLLTMYLGKRLSLLPFAIIALSPTLLYFTTLETSFGIDLQMLPICLLLLLTLDLKKRIRFYAQFILFWMLVMITWMSYATFVFYLPVFIVLFAWVLHNNVKEKKKDQKLTYFLSTANISLVAFIIPLAVGVFFVQNRTILLTDPSSGNGIFRGGGTLSLSQTHFAANFFSLAQDLFISGKSYNFELFKADFSDIYPLITLGLLAVISILLVIKNKSYRLATVTILGLILFTYIGGSITSDPTNLFGMRRSTPILAGIYALFVVAWYFVIHTKWQSKIVKNSIYGIFTLLLLHNILVFPINFSHLKDASIYGYQLIPGVSPTKSLKTLVKQTEESGLDLTCKRNGCRYQETYAAVAGDCLWNKLPCHAIYGYDYMGGTNLLLSPQTWEMDILPH